MKKLLILTILLSNVFLTFAQTNLEADYMELRFVARNGWQFRTSPNTFFQPMGYFGQKLKPYVKEDALAYRSFKKYRRNLFGMIGSATLLSASLTTMTYGLSEQNEQFTTLGIGGVLMSGGLLYFTKNKSLKHLQASVDLYNRAKNPTLTQLRRFIPSISQSRHNLGLSLVWEIY